MLDTTPILRSVLLACAALALGCGINPNGKSGGDGKRNEAKPLQLDEWVTDENGIDYKKGDRTDWKKIVVPRAGTLTVQVAVTEKKAQIDVSLYDKYGRLLLEKTKKRGYTDHLKFEGEVTAGNYFVRLQARKAEDNSSYDIRASMEGGAGIGDIPPPE